MDGRQLTGGSSWVVGSWVRGSMKDGWWVGGGWTAEWKGTGRAGSEGSLGRLGNPLTAVPPPSHRPLSQLALPQVLGLILNLPSPMSLGLLSLPVRRRHWVALRQVDGVYYNLDSKLRAPEALGDEDGVR